jgi:antitoxin MazE
MGKKMQIDLIKIGNSRGIRLPQNIIKECGFMDTVEAELINHCLILKAPDKPRSNWESLFKADKEEYEGIKDILAIQNSWDDEEWVW